MRRHLLGCVALALLLRVVVGLILVEPQGGDALEYTLLGHNLAHGHGYSLSTASPYHPTDWRPPGYPAVLALVSLLGGSDLALVAVNSILGAVTVALVMLIAARAFPTRPRLVLWSGVIAAVYPSFVTYTGIAYAENLAIPAVCLFMYLAFLCRIPTRAWIWVLAIAFSGAALALTRAEGIALVVLGLVLAGWVRRLPVALVTTAILAFAVFPVAWAVRNHHSVHRFELSDPLDRDVTLLLSTNDGNFDAPLYAEGVRLGHDGTSSSRARHRYHQAVTSQIRHALRDDTSHVLAYKAKSLLNFPFIPLVWTWSSAHDYSVSEAAGNPSGRNLLRLVWSLALVLQYALAVVGIATWYRQRQLALALSAALYPALVLLLAIPFHSELRLWYASAALLIVPAVMGWSVVAERWRSRGGAPSNAPELARSA